MTHDEGDTLEGWHHFLYRFIRGYVYESQYVGTVKMGEEQLEEELFHPNGVSYNWLAYWKKHAGDGRSSEGSWKLRYPAHSEYVGKGMQIHITLFQSRDNPEWIDVYAHYEYDNIKHPFKHLNEKHFSPEEGVARTESFFSDNQIALHQLH